MNINRKCHSPNYDPVQIPVEFLVLHYTAEDLENTLGLFLDPNRKVSSHLIIDENGEIYELVRCLEGSTQRAWHAGRSYWFEAEKKWEEFNNFSIGIEIVNLNGNLHPYTIEQYAALKDITDHLRSKYEKLNSPHRIVGHENIAGWRGKVDPGIFFDWRRFYEQNFGAIDVPIRNTFCYPEIADSFQRLIDAFPKETEIPPQFWRAISHAMETIHRLIQMNRTDG